MSGNPSGRTARNVAVAALVTLGAIPATASAAGAVESAVEGAGSHRREGSAPGARGRKDRSTPAEQAALKRQLGGDERPGRRRGRGRVCPVDGPTTFTDSWGEPRSGHTHEGVDLMGDAGTPVVAVVSGRITYESYDAAGGYMLFLSGDDGHEYHYMHNQANLVTSGRVETGERIARLGDSGNAAGSPHLHFEFLPGGRGPVNPTPLARRLCGG